MDNVGPMRVGGGMKPCDVTTAKHGADLSHVVAESPVDRNLHGLESEMGPVIGLLIGALLGTLIWILFGVAICTGLQLIPD
jgi:hypothetical protein